MISRGECAYAPNDIFFGIVQRGAAMIMLKAVGVDPTPNYTRDIGQGWAQWDAYINVPDADGLAAEFASRGLEFFQRLGSGDDGLRGFSLQDHDGYVLYFGHVESTGASSRPRGAHLAETP